MSSQIHANHDGPSTSGSDVALPQKIEIEALESDDEADHPGTAEVPQDLEERSEAPGLKDGDGLRK